MSNICIPFMIHFPYNDEISEFTIIYNADEDSYSDLVRFIEEYKDKRINIDLSSENIDVDLLKALTNINTEIYFKLSRNNAIKYKELRNANLNFFFDLMVYDWDVLHALIEMEVSDIYITGELGFNLIRIKNLLESTNIRLRAIVNLAQLNDPFLTNDRIRAFFIRPEDLELYSSFIDTFEFYYEEEKFKIQPLYEIYIKDGYWYGDLAEIIANLGVVLDSRTLIPEFGYFRINCGKKCYQGSACQRCLRMAELSEALINKGYIISEGEENAS